MSTEEIVVDFQYEYDGDLIFVAGSRDHVQSSGAMRPMMLVHDLKIDADLPPLRRAMLAQALSHFGQGYIRNRHFIPQGCLFHISPGNATMEQFARTIGGQPEAGQTYRIDYTKGG